MFAVAVPVLNVASISTIPTSAPEVCTTPVNETIVASVIVAPAPQRTVNVGVATPAAVLLITNLQRNMVPAFIWPDVESDDPAMYVSDPVVIACADVEPLAMYAPAPVGPVGPAMP
jgi:hypothetical protein